MERSPPPPSAGAGSSRAGVPAGVETYQISTPGLGDHSYLITSGGRAALIDPQRDLDPFGAGLAEVNAPLAMIMETHVHNDYVSGGRAMALRHGATHVLPADAGYTFDHHAVRDEDEMPFGDLTIRALHTPAMHLDDPPAVRFRCRDQPGRRPEVDDLVEEEHDQDRDRGVEGREADPLVEPG